MVLHAIMFCPAGRLPDLFRLDLPTMAWSNETAAMHGLSPSDVSSGNCLTLSGGETFYVFGDGVQDGELAEVRLGGPQPHL